MCQCHQLSIRMHQISQILISVRPFDTIFVQHEDKHSMAWLCHLQLSMYIFRKCRIALLGPSVSSRMDKRQCLLYRVDKSADKYLTITDTKQLQQITVDLAHILIKLQNNAVLQKKVNNPLVSIHSAADCTNSLANFGILRISNEK